MAALLAGMCSFGYAQDYLGAPKANEMVIGMVSTEAKSHGQYLKSSLYEILLDKAKQEHPGKNVDIRNMEVGRSAGTNAYGDELFSPPAVGKVVIDFGDLINGDLPKVLNKALRNVREGSRMAIDQVTVPYSMDKETLKDQLLDVLLDKGYRVVAKEYLDKLYEEQQSQQSGIYNDKTTVQENNFSAVGYYINVKVTETSLRVQVVNVSTGEYEGNATVNF